MLELDCPLFDSIFVVNEGIQDSPLLPIDSMNNNQLKSTLKNYGLSTKGNKTELQERLREHTTTSVRCAGPDTSPVHFDADDDASESSETTQSEVLPNEHNLALLLCLLKESREKILDCGLMVLWKVNRLCFSGWYRTNGNKENWSLKSSGIFVELLQRQCCHHLCQTRHSR